MSRQAVMQGEEMREVSAAASDRASAPIGQGTKSSIWHPGLVADRRQPSGSGEKIHREDRDLRIRHGRKKMAAGTAAKGDRPDCKDQRVSELRPGRSDICHRPGLCPVVESRAKITLSGYLIGKKY